MTGRRSVARRLGGGGGGGGVLGMGGCVIFSDINNKQLCHLYYHLWGGAYKRTLAVNRKE